jgi:hypothetical protein
MKTGLGIVVLLILSACKAEIKSIPKPDDVIPRDSLVIVLEDMMLLEGHVQSKYPQITQFHKVMRKSGDKLLAKYHMTYDRYSRSIDYYGSDQQEMQDIYNEVLESMNRKMNELQAK